MWKLEYLVALLFSIKAASAISCYECSSVNNSMCAEPRAYDDESAQRFLRVTECSGGMLPGAQGGEFFCRKIKQVILHKYRDEEVRITRGCGWKRHPRACYTADNADHLETVCQCFTDACNKAYKAHMGSVGFLGVLSVVIGLLMK